MPPAPASSNKARPSKRQNSNGEKYDRKAKYQKVKKTDESDGRASSKSHKYAKGTTQNKDSKASGTGDHHKEQPDFLVQAKKQWREAQKVSLTNDERRPFMEKLLAALEGHVVEIASHPEGSRILQTCLKYGKPEERESIVNALKGKYVDMMKKVASKFLFTKMLRYCTRQRNQIIREIHGNVLKLIRHNIASDMLEEVYVKYSNASQRALLAQELYGPEYALFKSDSDPTVTLESIVKQSSHKREAAFRNILQNVTALADKSLLTHSIVHQPIHEYLVLGNSTEIAQMIEVLQEHLVHLVHTREGSQAAMLILLHASAKTRKLILNALKPYVEKVCMDEYGYQVIIQLMDTVDDTVMLKKALLSKLTGQTLASLISHREARRALVYPFAGRSLTFLGTHVIRQLEANDVIRNQTSKKDAVVREAEVRRALAPAMLAYFEKHMEENIYVNLTAQVLQQFMINTDVNIDTILTKLGELLALAPGDENNVVEHKVAGKVIIALIQADYKDDIRHVALETPREFGPFIWEHVKAHLPEYAVSQGNYMVNALLNHPKLRDQAKAVLKPHLKSIKAVADNNVKGTMYILEKFGTSAQ
ncbi:Pumilio y domain member 6 [Dispira simplex]|nr:Pumilio y domain member 6 [Dispira simplex]